MDAYISRNAAIETVKFYEAECDPIPRAIDSLKQIPVADVVEVVRCSACKHVLLVKQASGKITYWCPVHDGYRCYDEFCNRGEVLTDGT